LETRNLDVQKLEVIEI